MSVTLSVDDLIAYADWERKTWQSWLHQQGSAALKTGAGAHGDGRFESVGDLVRHIFSAEKRYVDRLSGRPLTDASSVPNDDIEALFHFGKESRKDLTELLATLPDKDWDVPVEFRLMDGIVRMTPKKIVVHTLMHEIRHWAQIATVVRMNGCKGEFHDFLFSPVLGGEIRREEARV
jgi:uncharacterized damage-inducible protein DinB